MGSDRGSQSRYWRFSGKNGTFLQMGPNQQTDVPWAIFRGLGRPSARKKLGRDVPGSKTSRLSVSDTCLGSARSFHTSLACQTPWCQITDPLVSNYWHPGVSMLSPCWHGVARPEKARKRRTGAQEAFLSVVWGQHGHSTRVWVVRPPDAKWEMVIVGC